MVGFGDEEFDEMGYGEAYERYGSAESGDSAGEDAGGKDDPEAGNLKMGSDGPGVVIAEKPGVEGFCRSHGRYGAGEEDERENGDLCPVEAAHGSEGPDEIGLELFGAAEILEHLYEGCGAGADHDADNEEGCVIAEACGDGEHNEEYHGATAAGGNGHDPGAGCIKKGDAGGISHEYEGYGEAGAGGKTEDIGAGEGVAKKGLHLEARERQRAAGEGAGEGLGHTKIPDDVSPDGV